MFFLFSDTIGGMPEDQQTISPARARAKWNHNLRGIEIIQLGSTYPGMECHCIEDYLNIFTSGHTYVRNSTNDRWIDTTQKKHTHFADTDEDGGDMHTINIANAAVWVIKDFDPMRQDQWSYNTLGGAAYDNFGGCRIETNTVGGNFYQFGAGGNPCTYESPIKFFMRYESMTDHSARSSFRGGVNCEEVWEISNIRRMFGLEWCDDVGQDKTYNLFSSDGSERNSIVTSLTANGDPNDMIHNLRLEFLTGSLIKMVYDGSNVLATKTNAVPRTLYTNAVNTLMFGLKTNENANKGYYFRAVRLVGKYATNYTPW
jgi:hypothetical protein